MPMPVQTNRLILSLALVTVCACTERKPTPSGNLQTAAHIQLDTNRAVEIIGLRWWTVDMLQDSLGKYSPGVTLDSANIVAILRSQLHFADAAAHRSEQVFDENETAQLTIAVR